MDTDKKNNLVARVKRYLKQRRTFIWEPGIEGGRLEIDDVHEVAERAQCDWLFNDETGEAKFFEFM